MSGTFSGDKTDVFKVALGQFPGGFFSAVLVATKAIFKKTYRHFLAENWLFLTRFQEKCQW